MFLEPSQKNLIFSTDVKELNVSLSGNELILFWCWKFRTMGLSSCTESPSLPFIGKLFNQIQFLRTREVWCLFLSVAKAEIMTLGIMESCLLAFPPATNHCLRSDLILFHVLLSLQPGSPSVHQNWISLTFECLPGAFACTMSDLSHSLFHLLSRASI